MEAMNTVLNMMDVTTGNLCGVCLVNWLNLGHFFSVLSPRFMIGPSPQSAAAFPTARCKFLLNHCSVTNRTHRPRNHR